MRRLSLSTQTGRPNELTSQSRRHVPWWVFGSPGCTEASPATLFLEEEFTSLALWLHLQLAAAVARSQRDTSI